MACNADCGCPVSRMQPICSKDGVTNFFSPCHAGCRPPGRPNVTWDHWLKTGEDSGELPKDQYFNCSCVEAASVRDQTSLATKWLEDGAEAGRLGQVREAEEGWCEVPGCKTSMMYYMIGLAILGTVGSTGRVGNVLVALRCVEVRDKALSFGFQVSGYYAYIAQPKPDYRRRLSSFRSWPYSPRPSCTALSSTRLAYCGRRLA